jgi:small neutral amino acid transporter SnatA (MarC family)
MNWSAKFWWFTPATWNFTTVEERQVAVRLLAMGGMTFILLYIPEELLLDTLGVEDHVSAVLGGLASFLPALPIARKLGELMWPELVRKADENAAERKRAGRGVS